MRRPAAPAAPALLIAALLVGALLAGACNSQGSGGGSAAGAGSACQNLAQGVTRTTVKIGTSLPLTGGAAVAAQGFKAGLEAAVAAVNDRGGIHGRRIGLVTLDDGFEPARTVGNIRRLGDEERVFAVVGPAGSANLPGTFGYLAGKGMPMFGPVLPPDPEQDEVWLLGTAHADQVRVIVDWLAGRGVRTVGLFSQDNDLGAAFAAGLSEQAPKHGLAVVADEKVEPHSTDVGSAVLKLRAKNPEAVISGGDNAQTALLLKQARTLGWSPVIVGNSSSGGPGSPNTVTPAGDAADGFHASAILEFPTSTTPEVLQYRAAMERAGSGEADNAFALQNYASAQVFFHLLDQLGDDLCWEQFRAKAEALSDYRNGLIPPVTFGPLPDGRTGTKGARIARYGDGKWTFVTDFLEPEA